MVLTITNRGTEKLGHIFSMQGKKSLEVKTISCGDIGAVSKLTETKTGDTLCDPKAVISAPPMGFDEPCYSMAVSPKVKGQEDKIANGLVRLAEEDLTFNIENNAETHQMVLSGAGDIHIDVLCSQLNPSSELRLSLAPLRFLTEKRFAKRLRYKAVTRSNPAVTVSSVMYGLNSSRVKQRI
jgi:elongation factor G